MKAVRLFALIAALGLLASIPAVSAPGFPASPARPSLAQQGQAPGSQGAPPPSQQQMQQQQQRRQEQAQQAEQGQVFRGILMLQNGNYVLREEDGKTTYKLDHQDVLKKHDLDKKRVSVVGTLDSSSNTIHISKVILLPAGR